MRFVLLCLSLLLTASPSFAQEALGLAAPREIQDSGLLKHILPRFSLKTSIRVVADEAGPMVLATDPQGTAVLARGDTVYYLQVPDEAKAKRFADWITSDVGKRTIESFKPATGVPFSAQFDVVEVEEDPLFEGDANAGATLSLTHCGRCHVIGPQNRMSGLGSTPSFQILRALPDWSDRFQQFYALKPHAAFTQLEGVTEPFDPERPSPIVPVEMSIEDLDAILAYVTEIEPADLGAPLALQ
ncbi:MAG: hypothetical protein GJ676_04380 [Rhodobacteraceae bacterium]|nr:hypothetical protein [Paracoccaceae bacterium]